MNPVPRVLLADDEEDYLFVARRALAKAGVAAELDTAGDGETVLRLLGLEGDPAGGSPPQGLAVIFLDVNMPGLDGLEVLQRIRKGRWTRGIPVVMLSTSDQPEEVRLSYEYGANSYLVKRSEASPGAYLAEAVRYWVDLNEPPGRREGRRP